MAKTAGKNMVQPIKVELSEPRRVYDGFLKLDVYEVSHERFDGRMSEQRNLEVMERGDAASVILVDPDEEDVFLVEQFRLPTRVRGGSGWLLETAAGVIRPRETPQECLRREVIEETGYQVTELEEIARFFVSPGGTTERIFLYYAEVRATDKRAKGGGVVKDGENIRNERMKIEEFFDKLDRREFEDAKTIIAGQWLRARRSRLPAEKSPTGTRTVDYVVGKTRDGRKQIIGYKTGSILAVRDVDVWVNPTDCDMLLDPFPPRGRSVSAAIRQGGATKYDGSERIREDTIAKALASEVGTRGFVRPTWVVDTIAGALEKTNSVQRIFHVAVVPGAIGENLVSRHETLDVCVDRVLERIEGKNGGLFFGGKHYESVLFPILGTGHGGYFNSDVVPRLVQRALQFFRDNPRAKLSKIYFCAYTQSDREILERELSKLTSAGEIEK